MVDRMGRALDAVPDGAQHLTTTLGGRPSLNAAELPGPHYDPDRPRRRMPARHPLLAGILPRLDARPGLHISDEHSPPLLPTEREMHIPDLTDTLQEGRNLQNRGFVVPGTDHRWVAGSAQVASLPAEAAVPISAFLP
ncbi:hypothetical protein thsps117_40310 [Pseudomonas sp. No.117]